MEMKDVVCENEPLYMVYDFDPRETSFKTWMGFYEEFKFFIPELTKKRFEDILREHRKLYDLREGLNWWRKQKHAMHFIFNEDMYKKRLFPLSPTEYGNWEQTVKKAKRMKKHTLTIAHKNNGKGNVFIRLTRNT